MGSTKIVPTAAGVPATARAPDFMAGADQGTELLKLYTQSPRLKMVQPTSRKPFSDQFAQGDLVVVPMMQLVGSFGDGKAPAFTCVPLFMWPEWLVWNPLETKGTLPAVRERSFDRASVIAIKSQDERRRNAEPCPEDPRYKLAYVEHLNYMLYPLDGPLAEVPVAMSWSKGDHRAGSTLGSLITMRKAPLYGCRFDAVIRERENSKGRWYGVDMENPADGKPWVEQDKFDLYRGLREEYKRAYDDRALVVDYDDVEEAERPADSKEY